MSLPVWLLYSVLYEALFTHNVFALYMLQTQSQYRRLVWKKKLKRQCFPLIQPSFAKLTQLAQFDKNSHAW